MDVSTLAIALGYTKTQIEQAKREGFKVQVEQDRNILETTGEEKIFYFLPKNPQKPKDGYDEFVYANNNWEQVGVTDVDLSSYGAALSLEDGILSLLSSSGAVLSQVLIDRTNYVLTAQDKSDIAAIVLSELLTTQGVLYGNTSN